jgi:hypothetical protein
MQTTCSGFSLMRRGNQANVGRPVEQCSSEWEPSMSIQVEQKSYEMPPREGLTVTHFITVADIERSARYYEKVFGGGNNQPASGEGLDNSTDSGDGIGNWREGVYT